MFTGVGSSFSLVCCSQPAGFSWCSFVLIFWHVFCRLTSPQSVAMQINERLISLQCITCSFQRHQRLDTQSVRKFLGGQVLSLCLGTKKCVLRGKYVLFWEGGSGGPDAPELVLSVGMSGGPIVRACVQWIFQIRKMVKPHLYSRIRRNVCVSDSSVRVWQTQIQDLATNNL